MDKKAQIVVDAQAFGDGHEAKHVEDVIERVEKRFRKLGATRSVFADVVVTADSEELVAANEVTVVDTTSAGDSFNAGYLAARLNGQPAVDAAKAGHRLASVVIQHRGAIIPVTAMPADTRLAR